MSTRPIFRTHTHSWISILWDLDVVDFFRLFFAHATQLQSFKKFPIYSLLTDVCVSMNVRGVHCLLFIISVTKFTFSLSFSELTLNISIDQSHEQQKKSQPFSKLPHHITQNFRLAWRMAHDANADESERYCPKNESNRAQNTIESNRIESSPQPLSVTNFSRYQSEIETNDPGECAFEFFIADYCMHARTLTHTDKCRPKCFQLWAWFRKKKLLSFLVAVDSIFHICIETISCAMSFIIASRAHFLYRTFWCSIIRRLAHAHTFILHALWIVEGFTIILCVLDVSSVGKRGSLIK